MPQITLDTLDGQSANLGGPGWKSVIVYRGAHCPLCKQFLSTLEELRADYTELGVELIAVSADSAERAQSFIEESGFTAPVAVGLTVAHMRQLGVYISDPRSPEEAPAPFAEPALFVVNPEGIVQVMEKCNAPFVRPDMKGLLGGLEFVMKNDYPIRGTHSS